MGTDTLHSFEPLLPIILTDSLTFFIQEKLLNLIEFISEEKILSSIKIRDTLRLLGSPQILALI